MSAVIEVPVKENEIVSYNPANGEEVGRVKNFSQEEVNERSKNPVPLSRLANNIFCANASKL